MPKNIQLSKEAREGLQRGVNKLADAVAVTLGPRGRNVIIDHPQYSPITTKDGVTVARAIEVEDVLENVGVKILKEVALKTADNAGDGTTTAIVLAREIFNKGLEKVEEGAKPKEIKRGIDAAVLIVIEALKEMSQSISTKEEIEHIGTISSNDDEELGSLIADAVERMGKDGLISVGESRTNETFLEIVDGMEFDKGYLSPYFATDGQTMQSILEGVSIFIYDDNINNVQEILPIFEKIRELAKPVLVIAKEISLEVLSFLITNKMNKVISVVAVQSPSVGDDQLEILKDIATLTGGSVISKDQGHELKNVSVNYLGSASKVVVNNTTTRIIGGNGDSDLIKERAEELRAQIEEADGIKKEALKLRLAKFIGGVAIINVGASTQIEMKEKTDRVDDALNATRAAVEEGIVPGGGVALIRTLSSLPTEVKEGMTVDEQLGFDIVAESLQSPLETIVRNAGLNENDVLKKVLEGEGDYGFNAKTETYENLLETGVVDPVKVTRTAIENAASIAGLMLTTEAVITEIPVEDKQSK